MHCRLPTILAVALLTACRGAAAGEPSAPATRVRVTSDAAASGRVVGTLVGLDDESLTLRTSGAPGELRLRRESVARIEVSRRSGNRGKALLIGFLAGAASGAVLGGSSAGNDGLFTPDEAAGIVAAILAPVGALVGLAVSHGEQWEAASFDHLSVTIAPQRGGGAGLRVAIRF